MLELLTIPLVSLLVGALLMLILRPLVLWYWKISRAVEALESIALSLEQMPVAKEYRARVKQAARRVA